MDDDEDIDLMVKDFNERIAELEKKLAAAHNAMEALVEANAQLRRDLYEARNNKLTLKEQLP